MKTTNNHALITGASTGLGKAFAVELAARGYNLALIALPGTNITRLADDLVAAYNVGVAVFELDMTDVDALKEAVALITSRFNINFLVNNAGIGGSAMITETSFEKMDSIIQLNIRSTVLLTRLMIPHLLQQEQSYILNVSSMAAFIPIAYKTVYPASKAFISSFSLGLREELEGTGISVSVLYPGPIMTNSNTTRRIISQGIKGQMGLLSTTAIVQKALNATFKGQLLIIPGITNRMHHYLMNILPLRFKMRLVSNEVKKELNFNV